MSQHARQLEWIDAQHERMVQLVTEWANINSGSYNIAGLTTLADLLQRRFAVLGGELQSIALPPKQSIDTDGNIIQTPLGRAISIRKRPSAPLQAFLCIHMDTVYPPGHAFQQASLLDANTLQGPGVLDAKGGLAVMLVALEALEQSPHAASLGWEVLINPDEEIGSPGAGHLFEEAAKRHHLGLLFEPAMPGGALVSARKGSGKFAVVMRGRSAHAGREPHLGRNAIHALAEFIVSLTRLQDGQITVNVGQVEGGGPVNVVPDLAICRFNVRVSTPEEQHHLESHVRAAAEQFNAREGFSLELHGGFSAPPKPLTPLTLRLLEQLASCGRELGLEIRWHPSGGGSDGNRLAASGLPTVDSLGPRGGNIHSPSEFLLLDSLTERAKLTALYLLKLAAGEMEPVRP